MSKFYIKGFTTYLGDYCNQAVKPVIQPGLSSSVFFFQDLLLLKNCAHHGDLCYT